MSSIRGVSRMTEIMERQAEVFRLRLYIDGQLEKVRLARSMSERRRLLDGLRYYVDEMTPHQFRAFRCWRETIG